MYLTETQLKSYIADPKYNFFHLPMSSTLYGGLCMVDLLNYRKYHFTKSTLKLFVPHSFASIEEYYKYMGRELPAKDAYYNDPDDEPYFPKDYDGDITDKEIIDVLDH